MREGARDRRLEGLDNFGLFEPLNVTEKFGFPVIQPVYELPEIKRWIDLQEFRKMSANGADMSRCGLQLYNWDYKIQCLWESPSRYIAGLRRLGAVIAPDFSMYTDMPIIAQMWNHYKHNWLAAYWQENGVTVIPALSWSVPESYEWCFDGLPYQGVVSVSTQGLRRNTEQARDYFRRGYEEAMARLNPCGVVCYGKPFDFMNTSEVVKTVGQGINEMEVC